MANSILVYNGLTINERGEMLSLTDMWRAAGKPVSKEPFNWLRQQGTQEFVEHIAAVLSQNQDEVIQTLRGNDAGTWAHWQVGLAYAKYLSHEFHTWCNQVVRDHMMHTVGGHPQQLSPPALGKLVVTCMLEVADLCNVPRHYAIQVAAEEATRQTAMPWDRLLTQAKAMNDVPAEDVMLEPTELGKLFGLSGQAMNVWLSDRGLQEKAAGDWVPTEAGQSLCVRHAWVRGNKSGYNLKWRAATIEMMWKEAA